MINPDLKHNYNFKFKFNFSNIDNKLCIGRNNSFKFITKCKTNVQAQSKRKLIRKIFTNNIYSNVKFSEK